MTLRASLILTAALLAMLVWSVFDGLDRQGPILDRATADLNDFALHESDLHRDLLSARAGLLRNYDPVNQAVSLLNEALSRLHATGEANDATSELAPLAARQEELVETFKSNNALLQNGLAYFSLFSNQLRASAISVSLTEASNDLSAAMLQLTLDTSADTAQVVEHQIARLAAQSPPPDLADAVSSLLAYGRLLSRLLPATDHVLKDVLAMPVGAEVARAADQIATLRKAERMREDQFRILLYATSLLLLTQVAYFGLQLQRRRLAARQRARFERAVASLSVRLINHDTGELPGLVHEALAQLAEVASASRAYFVISGPSPKAFTWARPGLQYPSGWPEDVATLARQLPIAEHGITHVVDRQALPEGLVRAGLIKAGIRSWTCIAADGEQKVSYYLGLDRLDGDHCGPAPELRLLRMAFDAIANAVQREILTRDRAQLQQSLQRARQVETIAALTGGVAHNFNNIVGTILGYTEMLDEKAAAGPRFGQLVLGIRQAGERARTLIEQIMSYGRKRDSRRFLLDLNLLVAETVDQLVLSLPQSVTIVMHGMADGRAFISGEAAQLQHVIINLCNNAAQAMDYQGEVTVTTDVQELTQERRLSHGQLAAGWYVRLIVTDRGQGMRPETMDRIFEPFFTTRVEGNGLGLATVRSIVQDHGGTLHVESTPGTGSRFEAWLPHTHSGKSPVAPSSDSRQFGSGETVLLLGDDHTKLLHEEEVVAALGYEPIGFRETSQMYATVEATPDRFDVAVLSIAGFSAQINAARRLMRIKPSMPVIVVSAPLNTLEGDELKFLDGCEVIPQTADSWALAAALRRALDKTQQFAPAVSL